MRFGLTILGGQFLKNNPVNQCYSSLFRSSISAQLGAVQTSTRFLHRHTTLVLDSGLVAPFGGSGLQVRCTPSLTFRSS